MTTPRTRVHPALDPRSPARQGSVTAVPEIPAWVAALPTPSPWLVVALAVVVQLPRLLPRPSRP